MDLPPRREMPYADAMTIRLRAHHLLCMLTYAGNGYSRAFCDNFDRIAARLGAGEDIVIVAGPDDVCAPLLHEDAPHCLEASVAARDDTADRAISALLGTTVAPGARLSLDAAGLAAFRQAFAQGTSRQACIGCEWAGMCSAIASAGYAGTRLGA